MTKWTLDDYLAHYHERAGIQSESGIFTENQAEMQSANETLALFKEQENPTDEQIREFRIYMTKNKYKK